MATDATAAGTGHTSHLRWPRVPTLTLPQTTLRPGAQNTIYTFTKSTTTETTLRPITADLRYNVANIQVAAADLQFPDEEAIHELTIGGASLGNPELPLTTHICRNHQGSAKHWHAVTDQLRQWIDGKELRGPHAEALDDSRFDGFAYPAAIPAIAVPINGTEPRLREKYLLVKQKTANQKGLVSHLASPVSPLNRLRGPTAALRSHTTAGLLTPT